MKYCSHCGNEVDSEAVFCPKCGCQIGEIKTKAESNKDNSTAFTVAKVFAIISCITTGWSIIPLLWMIPMTIKIFKYSKENKVPSTGFNVCTILFLNTISGIALFFVKE